MRIRSKRLPYEILNFRVGRSKSPKLLLDLLKPIGRYDFELFEHVLAFCWFFFLSEDAAIEKVEANFLKVEFCEVGVG